MAGTTKTPSYALDIPERETTRKTVSSTKKSSANKKAEAAQLETEEIRRALLAELLLPRKSRAVLQGKQNQHRRSQSCLSTLNKSLSSSH